MAETSTAAETPLSPALKRDLAHLKNEIETMATPAHIEAGLMRAFAQHTRETRPASRKASDRTRPSRGFFAHLTHWMAPGAALAASVGMALWVAIGTVMMPVSNVNSGIDFTSSDAPFIALQSLDRIALEPSPRLIETVVPKMLLASYGVAVSPETAGDQIHAQMLVSAAGQPLALRFAP
jgi:hypothetical protein